MMLHESSICGYDCSFHGRCPLGTKDSDKKSMNKSATWICPIIKKNTLYLLSKVFHVRFDKCTLYSTVLHIIRQL